MRANLPKISFETPDVLFLQMSRDWLQDTGFRELIMAEPIEKEAQEVWFASLPYRSDYLIWGVKASDWIGACGLKNINHEKRCAEYWGYIYPTTLRGKGIGFEMFQHCRQYSINIGLKTLCLTVSEHNLPAQIAYQRWGFHKVSRSLTNGMHMETAL